MMKILKLLLSARQTLVSSLDLVLMPLVFFISIAIHYQILQINFFDLIVAQYYVKFSTVIV